MSLDDLTFAPEAFQVALIKSIIAATAVPDETETEVQIRAAAIIDMFKCYDPADTIEAITASHCVTLHFLLLTAMRAIGAAASDPKASHQAQSRVLSLARTLRAFTRDLQVMKKERAKQEELAEPSDSADAGEKVTAGPWPSPRNGPWSPRSEDRGPEAARRDRPPT